MTHYSTLIQRCRATNSLLADELSDEFDRIERARLDARIALKNLADAADAVGDIYSFYKPTMQAAEIVRALKSPPVKSQEGE